MRSVVALLTVSLWSLPLHAQDKAERFDYDVEWGYADVARVSIQRGCTKDGYRPSFLTAKSLGLAEQVHAFDIRLDSFATPDGRTLEGRTFIEEEGLSRRYRTRFASTGAAVTQKEVRDKTSQLKLKLRPGTYDLLSWFNSLRTLPISEGTAHRFYVWDGWKLSELTAAIGKLERVWTPAGTYDAYRIVVTRVRLHHAAKQYQPKSEREDLGTLWLTAAAMPVAMDFKAPVGLAKVRLSRSVQRPCAASK